MIGIGKLRQLMADFDLMQRVFRLFGQILEPLKSSTGRSRSGLLQLRVFFSSAVSGVQKEARKQKGGIANPIQRAGYVSTRKRPVQAYGQPVAGKTSVSEKEVSGAD